jgi:hypothetical protein
VSRRRSVEPLDRPPCEIFVFGGDDFHWYRITAVVATIGKCVPSGPSIRLALGGYNLINMNNTASAGGD